MEKFTSVPEAVQRIAPVAPVYCIRVPALQAAASWFIGNFPGKVLYAVKTNPTPLVLTYLHQFGIRHFDVASLTEVQLVHRLFGESCQMYFMHPIKNRDAIRRAYFDYGVRDFSLDTQEELAKILECTDNAKDLGLHIRLAIPNTHAEIDLSKKFGISLKEAPALLRKARQATKRLGVCFHVGSQCMHPAAYSSAMKIVKDMLKAAQVKIDVLDIGGGFPSAYPGMVPPPLSEYMDEIKGAVKDLTVAKGCELWCEPGRALVAESGSVVVQVDLRKGQSLYINDGTYGSLFDAGQPEFVYPVRMIHPDGTASAEPLLPFSFYGPTCDSMDYMKGPFYLPADIKEGDYIEIGQLGAYGTTLRTKFNGFYSEIMIETGDEPLMSILGLTQEESELTAAVA